MKTDKFNIWFKNHYDIFLEHQKNDFDIVKWEMQILTKKVNKWNAEYYIESNPTISDNQYDATLNLLERWEKLYPKLRLKNSPTVTINSQIVKDFVKKKHPEPMLSIQNAFVQSDIERFLKRCNDNDAITKEKNELYILEPKIDGVSIELTYRNGFLIQALTRGDGEYGHDVTDNFRDIFNIPKKINFKKEIIIRGELYIEKNIIEKCKSELKNHQKIFSQRNIVSGLIQRKKLHEKNSYWYFYTRYLKSKVMFFPYYIVDASRFNIRSQDQIYNFLEKIGFRIIKVYQNVKTITEIKKYYANILKHNYEFEMDGIVIKLNNFSEYYKFGKARKYHKWMIAWKFVESVGLSRILSCNTTVGRTGKISYVGIIKPVLIDNTIVSRVMMNSISHIREHNYFINSKIKIKKSGGIIPKIISVDNQNIDNLYAIKEKLFCPSCSWVIFNDYKKSPYDKSQTRYIQKCLNWNCPRAIIEKIVYFCSPEGLNIKYISRQKIKILFEKNIVKSIIDLYKLQKEPDVLAKAINSKTLASKIIQEISNSTKISSSAKILQAVGINMIGKETWELLQQKFINWKTIKKLNHITLESALSKTYLKSSGKQLTNNKAELVYDFLCNSDLVLFIDELFAYFPNLELGVQKQISQLLRNQKIAITGKFKRYSRTEIIKNIKQNGGTYCQSLNSKTNLLITNGSSSGSKNANALKFNTKKITIYDFEKLIKLENK